MTLIHTMGPFFLDSYDNRPVNAGAFKNEDGSNEACIAKYMIPIDCPYGRVPESVVPFEPASIPQYQEIMKHRCQAELWHLHLPLSDDFKLPEFVEIHERDITGLVVNENVNEGISLPESLRQEIIRRFHPEKRGQTPEQLLEEGYLRISDREQIEIFYITPFTREYRDKDTKIQYYWNTRKCSYIGKDDTEFRKDPLVKAQIAEKKEDIERLVEVFQRINFETMYQWFRENEEAVWLKRLGFFDF